MRSAALQKPVRESNTEVTLRPPLKWAGGKRWQLPHLRAYWARNADRRLVEPFCGGLAVTLGLVPEHALLNDVNPHLINFYRWLKRGLVISLPMQYSESMYYEHRDRFNALIANREANSKEGAELFYYLNRTGYNGLCRFNQQGGFNVPFGSYKTVSYIRNFLPYRAILASWALSHKAFGELSLEDDDFVYADPPYDVEFTQYVEAGFTWDDQVKTAEWLARHPGPVVLSNQATHRIVTLYERLGYELTFLDAPRRINCTGDRTPAKEVLAVRNL